MPVCITSQVLYNCSTACIAMCHHDNSDWSRDELGGSWSCHTQITFAACMEQVLCIEEVEEYIACLIVFPPLHIHSCIAYKHKGDQIKCNAQRQWVSQQRYITKSSTWRIPHGSDWRQTQCSRLQWRRLPGSREDRHQEGGQFPGSHSDRMSDLP